MEFYNMWPLVSSFFHYAYCFLGSSKLSYVSVLQSWIDTPHFVYSSIDGQLGCFYLLAIVNSVAINICVPRLAWVLDFSFFRSMPRIVLFPVSQDNSVFNLLRTCLFSLAAEPEYIHTINAQVLQPLHILVNVSFQALLFLGGGSFSIYFVIKRNTV